MKRLFIAILLPLALQAAAQERTEAEDGRGWWNNNPSLVMPIREVEITAARPMKDIGVQKTQIDTLALKENIAISMADVLTFNSSVFIKNYGRATLSTIAFRGTGPSHTQVLWNGMRINSPMLGMTDFSMIPSYFVDDARLLHGSSSVNVAGGGLGGAVTLSTRPAGTRGFNLQYTQGVGSYWTTDEFLRLTYGSDRWQVSTRAVYSSSPNEYTYRNHEKKENIYDGEHNIIGQYYPKERHDDGSFRDLHILQEVYFDGGNGNRFGLSAWFMNSERGLGRQTTEYGDPQSIVNEQTERTVRSTLTWDHLRENWKVGARLGYIYDRQAYDYGRDLGNGTMGMMTTARNKYHTLFAAAEGEYHLRGKWLFTADIAAYQHIAANMDRSIITLQGAKAVIGYEHSRTELSACVSARWTPTERLGLSITLREDMYGSEWTPPIPAFHTDFLLSKRGSVRARASVSRNYRYPTLNDMYYRPGGNEDLRPEHGITYDCGISFSTGRAGSYTLHGEATWFESYIDDWILWLPLSGNTNYWTPMNLKDVHSYGVELKAGFDCMLAEGWQLGMDGNFAWTPSVNRSGEFSKGDRSLGKQLPYVPEYSAAVTARLTWRTWRLSYKWCHYSQRFTTTSNIFSYTGYVSPYYMSDMTLEKLFSPSWAELSVKVAVKNLLNEEYISVLRRPMPRMNFEVFLDIRPKWGHRKK